MWYYVCILCILYILDDELKNDFQFLLTNDTFKPPNYKKLFLFYYKMSVECTNPNLKSAQTAQLGQPAPKLELDLYIPQT